MVKRSRPQWHLLFTAGGLLAVVAAALYVDQRPPPETVRSADPPPVLRPQTARAFADSVLAQRDSILADVGLLSTWVRVRAGDQLDTLDVKVPTDLPLASVNLALTEWADSLGGHVVRGVETRAATAVDLTLGFAGDVTTLVRLRHDRSLQRRRGRLTVIVTGVDAAAAAAAAGIAQPLTLVALAGAEAPAGDSPHEWRSGAAGLPPADTLAVGSDGADGVRRALWALAEQAADAGRAAAVLPAQPATFEALAQTLPRLERRGYRFDTAAAWPRGKDR